MVQLRVAANLCLESRFVDGSFRNEVRYVDDHQVVSDPICHAYFDFIFKVIGCH